MNTPSDDLARVRALIKDSLRALDEEVRAEEVHLEEAKATLSRAQAELDATIARVERVRQERAHKREPLDALLSGMDSLEDGGQAHAPDLRDRLKVLPGHRDHDPRVDVRKLPTGDTGIEMPTVTEETGDAERLTVVQEKILAVFRENPLQEWTPKAVAEETGLLPATVRTTMQRMADAGLLVKVGYGRYELRRPTQTG